LHSPPTLHEIAEEVAADLGQVQTVVEGDSAGTIFALEERHDSRLVQVEIAMMLNRLYESHGLRTIGLEGLAATESLDLSWGHWPSAYRPDQLITGREDVIVQMLRDGEISNAEMIGLIYSDVQIAGIEDAELYSIEMPDGAGTAPSTLLYNIALVGMTKPGIGYPERSQRAGTIRRSLRVCCQHRCLHCGEVCSTY
jgi:hypothetical protein